MDKPGVMALTHDIWDGHDYIPYVWDDWLADPRGLMVVAEYGAQLAGMGRLTSLPGNQWWLEGLRVHPELEGRGFARHIFDFLMTIWGMRRGAVIRLLTSSKRVKVHRMSEHSGYRKVGEMKGYAAQASAGSTGRFCPLDVAEVPQAFLFVRQSPPLAYGMLDLAWKWAVPTVEALAGAAQAGRAWWWEGGVGLLTMWEDYDGEEEQPLIQLLACPPERVADCLQDFRCLAASLGYRRAFWTAPVDTGLLQHIEAAGYSSDWSETVYLYERATDR